MIHFLKNLSAILQKGQTWADENGVEHSKLLKSKLADDSTPLPNHVQIASNASKYVLSRLAGLDVPFYEDNETTFDQLYERIDKTVKLLESADAKAFEGKEDALVAFKTGSHEIKIPGLTYLQVYAIPNFFLHVVTAYSILNHAGVPLNQGDYLVGNQTALNQFVKPQSEEK